jgi:hypothetical protein
MHLGVGRWPQTAIWEARADQPTRARNHARNNCDHREDRRRHRAVGVGLAGVIRFKSKLNPTI